MLFAFYPLFVVMILQANMTALGLIESLALLVGLLFQPVVGRLADLRGRINFVWVGYICLALSRLSQSLAGHWAHLVPAKVLYEAGRGIRNPPRSALLTDSVPQEERGLAFGILQSMDTAGAILGPLLGLGIFALLLRFGLSIEMTYRGVFVAAALPTLASITLSKTQLREVREPSLRPASQRRESPTAQWGLTGGKTLSIFTAVSCLFALWAVSENFLLVSGAHILGISREQIWPVVLLYWFINVTLAPTALLAGSLSDRYGRRPFVFGGFLVLAVLTASFAFATRYWQVGMLFALHGIYQGLLKPSQIALVARSCSSARARPELGRLFHVDRPLRHPRAFHLWPPLGPLWLEAALLGEWRMCGFERADDDGPGKARLAKTIPSLEHWLPCGPRLRAPSGGAS